MKKIIRKENRIDALWDKYCFECQLRGFAPDTMSNKEDYFSVFYRFMENAGVYTTDDISQEFFDAKVLSPLCSLILWHKRTRALKSSKQTHACIYCAFIVRLCCYFIY